jgi:superfamily II DNA or RNA helicase
MTKEEKQDLVQKAALKAWKEGGEWGLLAMATGTGKSKVAIEAISELHQQHALLGKPAPTVLIIVPTEKLRDTNWEDEFKKWDKYPLYASLTRSCYASILTYSEFFDLVVLDEGHSLTELSAQVFLKNSIKRLLVLSATPPDPRGNQTDQEKVQLFKQFRIKTDFYYPLEQARKDGLAPKAELYIVETTLDNSVKYIEAGSKANRFLQTEQQRYEFLSKQIRQLMISKKVDVVKFKSMERRRLIANSISKKDTVKKLITRFAPGNRTLVFGGGIAQIEELLPGASYHSKSGKAGHQALADFQAKLRDILGCVDGLNEGMNLVELDVGIIAQISSVSRELVQRIGRFRIRPNHVPVIFIVICVGTQDEEWLKTALNGLGDIEIKYVHAKNL